MSAAEEEKRADEARATLLSDIQELKQAKQEIVRKVDSKLPLIVGGVVSLLAIAVLVAVNSKRPSVAPPRRSLLGKAVRAAALFGVGVLARRLVTRAVDKALPEGEPAFTEPEVA